MNAVAPLWLLPTVCGLFGLLVGSFLNVVVYRVPNGLSIVSPPSACPTCSHPVRWFDNLPVVSWLALGGKCRDCKTGISLRYPAVEAFTALLWAGAAAWLGWSWLLPVFLYMAAVGVALFLIDLDVMRLPDQIVLPSYAVVAVGLVAAGFASGEWPPFVRVACSMLLWLAVFGIPWILNPKWMGFGDVKLAPILGALLGWLGWAESVVGLMGGFAIATVVSVVVLARAKRRLGQQTRIPYGPFMLLGAGLAIPFGGPVADLYLRVAGLA